LHDVTVIIPARNAARVLPRTLEALGDTSNVIVVDNHSKDATAAVAKQHGAEVVTERRRNRGRARNTGAALSSTPLLAFLDADCAPDPGWLEALTTCLRRHEVVGGRTIVEGGFDGAWRLDQERTIAEHGWSGAGNLGVRTELFARLQGFDERFRHAGEDVDFCLRAGTIAFCPDAVVRHAPAATRRQVFARGFRHGHGSVQLGTRRDWRHPRPMVAGDWALQRFGIEDERWKWWARADYAGRVAGSLWAELRRAR
jgi:glycosyltransferase involved in cell wall biosynthesis